MSDIKMTVPGCIMLKAASRVDCGGWKRGLKRRGKGTKRRRKMGTWKEEENWQKGLEKKGKVGLKRREGKGAKEKRKGVLEKMSKMDKWAKGEEKGNWLKIRQLRSLKRRKRGDVKKKGKGDFKRKRKGLEKQNKCSNSP